MIYFFGIAISLALVLNACQKQQNEIEAQDSVLKAKMAKIEICHLNGNGDYNIIEINKNALDAHLAHGDMVVFPQVGSYDWNYYHMGNPNSLFVHDMEITEVGDGEFSGTGFSQEGTAWTLTGTYDEAGNVEFTIVYVNGYTVVATGVFACGDGASGTATVSNGYGDWTAVYLTD